MKSFIDKRHKTFAIVEQKLFFLGKKRFWIWMRLGTKWHGVDQTVTPFSNRDSGIFIVHVNTIERGSVMFLAVKKSKLGKFE
jgi:hypothetical protein